MFCFTDSTEVDKKVTLDSDTIEKLAKFSYLGDVLSFERRVQEAVTTKTRSGWKKFKDIASVLCKSCVTDAERNYV